MNFRDFILQFEEENTALGDFARDLRLDPTFPLRGTLVEYKKHLQKRKGVSLNAVTVLVDAYKIWIQH
jgi:hypothetical protein